MATGNGLFGTGARVGPIRQTAIQPTGIPGSTFVRAPMREAGGNLRALAEALGGLNSALQNFASVQKNVEEDPNSRANKEWIARRQQMSLDELISEVQNETHDGIRIKQDAVELLLAERANSDLRQRWMEFYNTEFDHTTGDAAAEYERMRQEFAERLPSEVSRGHLYRLTQQHFQSWMEQDVKTKSEFARGEMHTTILGSFRNAVDDARAAEITDPNQLAKLIFQKSAGNRAFLGLTGEEQNALIFQLAAEYATEGDEAMVKALLENSRMGPDGSPVGPLAGTAQYSLKAKELIAKAGDQRAKLQREQSFDAQVEIDEMIARGEFDAKTAESFKGKAWSDQELANFVERSEANKSTRAARLLEEERKRLHREEHHTKKDRILADAIQQMGKVGGLSDIRSIDIPAASGQGMWTYTAEAIKQDVINFYEAEFNDEQQRLIDNQVPPGEAKAIVDRKRLEFYSKNYMANEKWRNMLNGMAARATTDFVDQKGGPSDFLRQTAQLYRQIKTNNPAYLATVLTDERSKEFFDVYDAMAGRGLNEEEALAQAAYAISAEPLQKMRNQFSEKDISKIANSVLAGFGGLGADKERGINEQFVARQIARMSRNGLMQPSEVKERVQQEIAQTTVPINGVLVSAAHETSPDFAELIHDELAARVEKYGAAYGVTDPSNLTVIADGTETRWMVVDKTTGFVIGAEAVTLRTLDGHRQRRKQEADARFEELKSKTEAERKQLKAEYDAQVAKERARIEYWRKLEERNQRFASVYAGSVADDLERRLEERLARERVLWETTPKQRGANRRKKIEDEARKNATDLGFTLDR